MSGVGNDSTFGNNKSNYHWQLSMLQILGENNAELKTISASIGGVDYEIIPSSFKANSAGTGYSSGDYIQRRDIINAVTGAVASSVWFNMTTQAVIAAPTAGHLDPYIPPENVTLQAGSAIIGNVGGITAYVSSTITMSVAGAYATGDYMGTTTTPQSFTNVVRSSGGTGIIKSITISDKIATANVAMELWLFSATFTAPTDNAAWAISDAENLTVLGVIPIGSTTNSSKPGWFTSSNGQVYIDDTLSIVIKPAATSLFYALVARGTTPAFTSGDLTLNLGILQD